MKQIFSLHHDSHDERLDINVVFSDDPAGFPPHHQEISHRHGPPKQLTHRNVSPLT